MTTLKEIIKRHFNKIIWIVLILILITLGWRIYEFHFCIGLSNILEFYKGYFSTLAIIFIFLYLFFGLLIFLKKKAGYYGLFITTILDMILLAHPFLRGFTDVTSLMTTLIPLVLLILSWLLIYSQKKESKKKPSLIQTWLSVTIFMFIFLLMLNPDPISFFFSELRVGGTYAEVTLHSFLGGWLTSLIPLLIAFTLGTLFLRSKLKPKLAFLLPIIAIPLFSIITWIEATLFNIFSGEMGGYGFVLYMFFGNIIFFIFSIIYAIVLYKKKCASA